MTGETQDKTEPWTEEHGVEYAYAYLEKDDLGTFMKALGMGGYPSAVLVDPKGDVVWSGHPSSINDSLIKKHLRGADRRSVDTRAVVRHWPAEASAASASFVKGDLARALSEARKLELDPNPVAADIERVVQKCVTAAKAMHDKGDYLGFTDAVKEAEKKLDGLPGQVELDELLRVVKKDSAAKDVISGQEKLRKMAAAAVALKKEKDVAPLERQVEKLAQKYAGTYVQTEADELLKKLGKKREQLHRHD